MKVKSLSRVRLLATPWSTAYQAPPSMGFSRQEYWSGVPLPSPGCQEEMLCVCNPSITLPAWAAHHRVHTMVSLRPVLRFFPHHVPKENSNVTATDMEHVVNFFFSEALLGKWQRGFHQAPEDSGKFSFTAVSPCWSSFPSPLLRLLQEFPQLTLLSPGSASFSGAPQEPFSSHVLLCKPERDDS